jgi:hypothetical protein
LLDHYLLSCSTSHAGSSGNRLMSRVSAHEIGHNFG